MIVADRGIDTKATPEGLALSFCKDIEVKLNKGAQLEEISRAHEKGQEDFLKQLEHSKVILQDAWNNAPRYELREAIQRIEDLIPDLNATSVPQLDSYNEEALDELLQTIRDFLRNSATSGDNYTKTDDRYKVLLKYNGALEEILEPESFLVNKSGWDSCDIRVMLGEIRGLLGELDKDGEVRNNLPLQPELQVETLPRRFWLD